MRTARPWIGLVALAALLLIASGFWMPQVADDDDFFALRKNFEIFGSLYEELVAGYVDPVDAERTMRRGIYAMLADLDPYTVFIDEASNININVVGRAQYGTVGLSLDRRGGRVTVSAPSEEGAGAYRQGVRAGDVLLRVAGQPADSLSLSDINTLLRGEPGSTVEVEVERAGMPAPLGYVLTRERLRVRSVGHAGFLGADTAAALGYVKLDLFAGDAAGEVVEAVRAMQDATPLRGLVLDLRDNPGGRVDQAVDIAGLFLPPGSAIVTVRGRLSESERTFRSRNAPMLPDLPLVVLMSELSASASEIVAGALQDYDRAVILGAPSFGKGLVQQVRRLPYNTSLKLTTGRYYIPSGRSIQAIDYGQHDGRPIAITEAQRQTFRTAAGRAVKDGRGIEPDVEIGGEAASALEAALIRQAAFFLFANDYVARHPVPPEPVVCSFQGRAICSADVPFLQAGLVVDDALYAEFRTWLGAQDFQYRTEAEFTTDDLAATLAALGYDTDDAVEALRQRITEEKAADFDRYADALRARLRAELISRYLEPGQQIQALLNQDEPLQRAIALLENPRDLRRLLQP